MTSIIQAHIINAFDHDSAGGNPAAVVLDADALLPAQKQKVAARLGLSETAFVSRSGLADFKLEFFTPNRQIAHCGHATIATFSYLRQIGRVKVGPSSKETIDGRRDILIEGNAAFMEQRSPVYDIHAGAAPVRIRASLGLAQEALAEQHPPIVCSTGARFLLVALRDRQAMQLVVPDFGKIHAISEELDLIGFYLWCPAQGDCAATTRMFAPRYGITEESGTGMAAGPLGCYLHDFAGVAGPEILIEQGAFMAPPSNSRLTVKLEVRPKIIERLFVGGTARHVRTVEVAFDAGDTSDR
jgi:PhzF family phenazine biosynthesis protein